MQTSGSSSAERIPFPDLSQFSRLFTDYLQFSPEIAPFFTGDYRDTASFETVAEQTSRIPRDRNTLADVLFEQNTRWGLDEPTRQNIEALRDPETLTIVTGQQLGLFLSPLYIPYKTLTTILLASKMEKELNKRVVPIFWLASEDHDFAEVASFHLIDGVRPSTLTYSHDNNLAGAGPVGRIPFSGNIQAVIDQAAAQLPQTANTEAVLTELRTHFKSGQTYTEAFAPFLRRIFNQSGLVIVDADDQRLKKLCAPLIRRELDESVLLTERLEETTKKLTEQYHAQVTLRPTNFFLMDDDARIPIDAGENQYSLRNNATTFAPSTLLEMVDESPQRFSPNVILRPIIQDVLFPTIAYVAGPGEIAYYAQARPAYEWAGLPMPIIFPRASMTLIEPAIDKILKRYDWHVLKAKNKPELLIREHAVATLPFDIQSLSTNARDQIDVALSELKQAAISLEGSLTHTAGSTAKGIEKHLDRFVQRIVRAQKRRQTEDQHRIHKAHAHLFPGGKLQERTLSPLHFLNRYGLDFFTSLMRDVSLDTSSHQVIRL